MSSSSSASSSSSSSSSRSPSPVSSLSSAPLTAWSRPIPPPHTSMSTAKTSTAGPTRGSVPGPAPPIASLPSLAHSLSAFPTMTVVTNDMVHYGTLGRTKGVSEAKVRERPQLALQPEALLRFFLDPVKGTRTGLRPHFACPPNASAGISSLTRALSPFLSAAHDCPTQDEAATGCRARCHDIHRVRARSVSHARGRRAGSPDRSQEV
ncbi:hypothetical protein ONZ51_g1199 [Trametes cubensis]|uniref:Uncharacterized protein n=1 Tax=Trametes cubensis TaxID=1111947 RepID=A0AAD7U2M7_9APHY|nr:hypothetical protein ONZ51_g1199 [Trametes cubensis]